jgi:hypothetical protein
MDAIMPEPVLQSTSLGRKADRSMAMRGYGEGWGIRAVLALGLMALATGAIAAKPGRLSVRTERAQDTARQVRDGRDAVIEVTSPSGIGRMTLVPATGAAWPSPLRLRLRYAPGRPFRTLEGLDLSVDGAVVATRETMRVEAGRAWLDVVLPADTATPGKPLHVQWVDAYRR